MTFNHRHHQKILKVLSALNREIFEECGAFFGGGTLISLMYDEFRWSRDIDFICPVGAGYRRLRSHVFEAGHKADFLFRERDAEIMLPRDIQANQYGIRFTVVADDTPIKFEIVAEGRIQLEAPEQPDWCNLPCLSRIDRFSEKLLANADRWADTSTKARDLIDLAVLQYHEGSCPEAFEKATKAYPVIGPLHKAICHFMGDTPFRQNCFASLQIGDTGKVVDGVRMLSDFLHRLDQKKETEPFL